MKSNVTRQNGAWNIIQGARRDDMGYLVASDHGVACSLLTLPLHFQSTYARRGAKIDT